MALVEYDGKSISFYSNNRVFFNRIFAFVVGSLTYKNAKNVKIFSRSLHSVITDRAHVVRLLSGSITKLSQMERLELSITNL